jgi:solute carrier family 25 (mitochondrial carnitine/acylcarnitine transporter), member 20/29
MAISNDFIYGLCGGFTGTILSHPFDTVKTRIQTNTVSTIRDAIKMKSLYAGLTAPLIGIMFEKSIVFGFYDKSKQYGFNNFTSGLIGGFMSTVVVTPIDRIKISYQNKEMLNIRNLYKGFTPTIFRETPGFGIYFYTYNKLKERFNGAESAPKTFLFGAISGLSAWVFIYPSDLIKTNYQSEHNGNRTLSQTIKAIIGTNNPNNSILKSFKNLYKGFNLAIMRAMPLHGGVFLGYELAKKYI